MVEAWIVGGVIGYLLGSIPTGLWIGQWRGGGDIRASGSGRTGATNTFRALGIRWSVTVLVLDAVKGGLPVLIVMAVWDSPTGEVVGGLAAVVGHQFPLYARFLGGRGAATGVGGDDRHLSSGGRIGPRRGDSRLVADSSHVAGHPDRRDGGGDRDHSGLRCWTGTSGLHRLCLAGLGIGGLGSPRQR